MYALQVSYEGSILATAGTPHATLLSVGVTWPVDEKWPRIDISGMNEYEDKRLSHTSWLAPSALRPGGCLELRLLDTDAASPPERERFTDTDDYRAGQAEYEETLVGPWPEPPPMARLAPQAVLALQLPGQDTIRAEFADGADYLFFHCMWSAHAPAECRVSLASKRSEEIQARRGGRDWFHGKLKLGECCRIDIGSGAA